MSEELIPPPQDPERKLEKNNHALNLLNDLARQTPDDKIPTVLSSIFELPTK